MTKFEIGKKYRHKDHKYATPFKILAVGPEHLLYKPVGSNIPMIWPLTERHEDSYEEVVEPKTGTVWVNIYPLNGRRSFSSKLGADIYKETERDGVRIACIEVPWTEGQGL